MNKNIIAKSALFASLGILLLDGNRELQAREQRVYKTVAAGTIAERPKEFYGRKVAVKAEVEDILNQHVLTLDEDELFAGPDVLVVIPKRIGPAIDKGERVTIYGTVRSFEQNELERDYEWYDVGWFDNPDVVADWEQRPVIIADSARTENGATLVFNTGDNRSQKYIGQQARQQHRKKSDRDQASSRNYESVTAGSIAESPKKFYGDQVKVQAEVEEIFNKHALSLDEDDLFAGPDVMVLIPKRTGAVIDEGERVTIYGTVRSFEQNELEGDYEWYDVGWFDNPDVIADWEQRPVIIADSARTENGAELVFNGDNQNSGQQGQIASRGNQSQSNRQSQQQKQMNRSKNQSEPIGVQVIIAPTLVTTAGKIAESPNRFYGNNVQVTAEVENVKNKKVFTLDEDEMFAGPDVLVLVPSPLKAAPEGQKVTVTGKVHPFIEKDFERDYDWFYAGWYDDPDFWITWTDRPVIVADSIKTAGGTQLAAASTEMMALRAGEHKGQGAEALLKVTLPIYTASPGAIAQNPSSYYGKPVSVRAEVEDVFSPHGFTLDEDNVLAGPDVLVFVPHPAASVPDGRQVTVLGVVRPFIQKEFERDYGWFDINMFDNPDVVRSWEKRAVIVAASVMSNGGRQYVQAPRNIEMNEAAGAQNKSQRQNEKQTQQKDQNQTRQQNQKQTDQQY